MPGGTHPNRPPSVDALARSLADTGLPHDLLVHFARTAIAEGSPDDARTAAAGFAAGQVRRVINATGVLLHTNLGRAQFAVEVPAGATTLEFDLATGQRGNRFRAVGQLAARACGGEAAIVVNNGAAAVLLALAALASGRGVAVARGESVEIGGGFRIPEVAEQSGARLVDVGTTNRTRVADFERAIAAPGADIACVLRVHPSNFRVTGFTESVPIGELRHLPVPVVADIGSGLLDETCPWLPGAPPPWLRGEIGARQALADGAGLVTFSGDKLLGGPQAGFIVGRRDLVERCARHPLARALRPGGALIIAVQNLLLEYLRRDGAAIPFWRMATVPVGDLRGRAERIIAKLADTTDALTVIEVDAVVGGGSAPGATIPSIALAVDGDLSTALRAAPLPVIARVERGLTICDLRSVDPADDDALTTALATALAGR